MAETNSNQASEEKVHEKADPTLVTLFVGRFPHSTTREELLHHFSKYGQVKNIKMLIRKHIPPRAFVTFADNATAAKVMKSPHNFKGRWLNISHKIYTAPNQNETDEALSVHNVLTQLQTYKTTADKIKQMCSLLHLTEEDLKARQTVLKHVEEILRNYYPQGQIVMYGSSANGYGFKNCDLDLLFLPTPDYCNLEVETQTPAKIPTVNDFLEGTVTSDSLSKMDECSHLVFVLRVLRKHLSEFRNSCLIPAKCPIVNFVYEKIVCDLSCSNRLVYFNTHLLKLLGDYDPRVKPLITVLRYWSKALGFVKSGFISSYAFTLLIIFFLQNTKPAVLPTIEELIRLSGTSRKIGGWECSFVEDIRKIPKSKNRESIEKLLMGFFTFYLNFDFIQYVASPLKGKVISITEIKKSADEKMKDFKFSCLCIQDPFDLSHNVCKGVRQRTLNNLKKSFYLATENFKNAKSPNAFNLEALFDNKFAASLQRVVDANSTGAQIFFWLELTHDVFQALSRDEVNTIELWYQLASHAVYDTLQRGLLMECEVIDLIPVYLNGHQMEVDGHASNGKPLEDGNIKDPAFCDDIELIMSIQCIVYSSTWVGRNNACEAVPKNPDIEDPLVRESDISMHVINTAQESPNAKEAKAKGLRHEHVFLCDCYRYTKYSIKDILCIITPLAYSKGFSTLGNFLRSYIPKVVEQVLVSGSIPEE